MKNDEAINYLENMKWFKGYDNTMIGDKPIVDIIDGIITLLKEQEESIPISWLEERLECHPELPYAVTDGITNVLYLWEGR